VVHLFRDAPARGDAHYVADAEGGARVVDEDVAGGVEMLVRVSACTQLSFIVLEQVVSTEEGSLGRWYNAE